MVNTVTQLVGAVLFNLVYQATLGLTFQRSLFILCAALVLIPFCTCQVAAIADLVLVKPI